METVEPQAVTPPVVTPAARLLSRRVSAMLWMLLVTACYAGAMKLLHGGLAIDRPIDDLFFTRPCTARDVHACWTFNKSADVSTFFLHTIPEKFFVIAGVVAALVFIGSFFKRLPRLRPWREHAGVALVAIAGVSSMVGTLKYFTGHYCPSQLAYFGGAVTHVPFDGIKALCFPAGHPAPAFGLLVFCFSGLPRPWRRFGLFAGLGLGTLLSVIQFSRGEHFLSHALATLLTALFLGCAVKLFYVLREPHAPAHR